MEAEWPAALSLLHRAFIDEPFNVEMYGEDRLTRWAASWKLYEPLRHDEYALALAACADQTIVGILIGSLPEHCHVCNVLALEQRPEDSHLAIDWEFHHNIAAVHAPLGPHAWVEKVAVEPTLRGLGIGRLLLNAAQETLRRASPTALLLECQPHLQTFYETAGFECVATFPDPSGPDALLMRRMVP
jgi:GNAT superfamily N-acetyltransferase